MGDIERRRMRKNERRKKRILRRKEADRKKSMLKWGVKRREGTFEEKWDSYFGHSGIKPHEGATCVSCVDYLKGSCNGGNVPEHCMKEKRLAVYSYAL